MTIINMRNTKMVFYASISDTLHFRHTPFQDGDFNLHINEHDESCAKIRNLYGRDVFFSNYAEYFSIRFTSPTHFKLWNDDLNIPIVCINNCERDIPSSSEDSYVSISAIPFLSQGASFTSTAFPIKEPTTPEHSSVVFIPGLEASRLYVKGNIYEDRLWEPNWYTDVKDLYLDLNGKSIKQGVYTQDIVDSLSDTENIYESFKIRMDNLVRDNVIFEWRPLPYDWRYDYQQILTEGTRLKDGSITKMIEEVEYLASRSNTKKVTIIAHSNGGLIAKALIKRLEDRGKGDLVDKLVLVAVPQMGTPEIMNVLLHGDKPGWLKFMFVPKAVSRTLAEHSQGIINILPTEAYFSKVTAPVIEFDPKSKLTEKWRSIYGNSIDSIDEMRAFLVGSDGRPEPKDSQDTLPNVIQKNFIDKAIIRAKEQDSWTPPKDLKIIQIVGWGLETVRGIKYMNLAVNCPLPQSKQVCAYSDKLDQRPIMTTDGDKRVISYSADKMNVETWYVNLQSYDQLFSTRISHNHADIFEVPDLLDAISVTIQGKEIEKTRFLINNKPTDTEISHRLSVHSPVSIDLYDSFGNHTGIVPNSDPLRLPKLEEQIPNSSYLEFGEGKYISVPASASYNVVMKGTDFGSFTLESEHGTNGDYVGGPIYQDIPVNPNTIATIILDEQGNTDVLKLDIDGDGKIDVSLSKDETISASSLLDILEYQISKLNLKQNQFKKFDKKIEKIRKTLDKQKVTNAVKRLSNLEKLLRDYTKKGKITLEQTGNLLGLIEQIKRSIK